MRNLFIYLFLCIFLSFSSLLKAEEPHSDSVHQEAKEGFNVNELIMHHIKDAHEWHLFDYKNDAGIEVSVSVPLPIILFHDGQLSVFMSNKFEESTKGDYREYSKGDYKYILYHEKIYLADSNGDLTHAEADTHSITNAKPYDFSITKNVASMLFVSLLVLFLFIRLARSYKTNLGRPRGIQSILEPLVLFVKDDIVYPNLGHRTDKFLPYLLTVFFFILFNNLLGIIPIFPGGANVTGNIAVTMTLALFTFFAVNLNGNKHYWRHTLWMPGVPVFVRPILAVVELMGLIVKPVALTIRLFANITAGHIIILSLVSLIFIFQSLAISPVSVIFVMFMNCLELLVAFLQAYIFTMLSSLFISIATAEAHH